MSGSKPAARLTDFHSCPQSTALVPHIGGPVIRGSPDVFINGLPAARAGDQASCVGPEDTIVTGSPTVFINGKPAARMSDLTAHGGQITTGSPDTFIGDSSHAIRPDLPEIDVSQEVLTLRLAAHYGKPFCAVCQKS